MVHFRTHKQLGIVWHRLELRGVHWARMLDYVQILRTNVVVLLEVVLVRRDVWQGHQSERRSCWRVGRFLLVRSLLVAAPVESFMFFLRLRVRYTALFNILPGDNWVQFPLQMYLESLLQIFAELMIVRN
jgi:hypothetical protein